MAWLLEIKQLPYELVFTRPPKDNTPEFLRMNPNALVPVLQDRDFSMYEGNAILAYLANTHQWTDMYPTEPRARAKVDQYLNWHHTNARESTTKVFRPLLMQSVGRATSADLEQIKSRDAIVGRFVGLIETFLSPSGFVAESDTPTLADIACYCELDQLEAMEAFDFAPFPNTLAWMQRMKQLPSHDKVRTPMHDFLAKFKLKPSPKI